MFYSQKDLIKKFKFKKLGANVLISDKASIYNSENISIGNNVRIDDFCILSPGSSLNIGNYIHIACYTSIIGLGNVYIEDFANLSSRVSVYTSNDDYTGVGMTNPMIPKEFRNVANGDVIIKRHTIIGCNCVILPNVTLNEGVSVHALSLIYKDCSAYGVYAGVPAKYIRPRKKDFLLKEKQFLEIQINKGTI